MIKLPFSSINEARANPAAYKSKLASGNIRSHRTYGPNQLLQAVINRMHNGGLTASQGRADLATNMRARFPMHRRTTEIMGWFDDYMADYARLGYSHALGWTNVSVPLPPDIADDLTVSGRVTRVDLVPAGGYAAWLFSVSAGNWQTDPRLPLLQRAVAQTLGCATSDVGVGVYCFDEGVHHDIALAGTDLTNAENELRSLLLALR